MRDEGVKRTLQFGVSSLPPFVGLDGEQSAGTGHLVPSQSGLSHAKLWSDVVENDVCALPTYGHPGRIYYLTTEKAHGASIAL